jgi:hypothetical protein
MKSTKTMEGVARAHSRTLTNSNKETASVDSEAEDAVTGKGGEVSAQSRRFGQTVNEKIVDNSNAILKGVRITSQQISGDRAVVMLEVSQQSINTAKNISRQMSGMMQ